MIRGRDKSSLVISLTKQQEVVAAALASYDVRVRAMFCFLGAELPWLRVPTIQGYPCREIVDTRKQLRADGPLDEARRREIWGLLARAFPPA